MLQNLTVEYFQKFGGGFASPRFGSWGQRCGSLMSFSQSLAPSPSLNIQTLFSADAANQNPSPLTRQSLTTRVDTQHTHPLLLCFHAFAHYTTNCVHILCSKHCVHPTVCPPASCDVGSGAQAQMRVFMAWEREERHSKQKLLSL